MTAVGDRLWRTGLLHAGLLRAGRQEPWIDWLRDRGSLTARLQARGHFAVRVLRQELTKATPADDDALKLRPGKRVWIREVALYCNEQPVVFAHTVLPYRPRGPLTNWLARLGNRSLGAMLFSHAGFKRGPMNFKRLDRRHALFESARRALRLVDPMPHFLWARRSHFFFDAQAVLVSEVFSPAVLLLPTPERIEQRNRTLQPRPATL